MWNLFKVNSKDNRAMCEICSELTIKIKYNRIICERWSTSPLKTLEQCEICSKLTIKTQKDAWNLFKVKKALDE